jgi:hypothetical protein
MRRILLAYAKKRWEVKIIQKKKRTRAVKRNGTE